MPEGPGQMGMVYELLPEESLLYVIVRKDRGTLASGAAHDHVVRATGWSGRLVYSPENPESCHVRVSIPVSGLLPDEPLVRERVGLPGTVGEDDRREIRETMLGAGQLDGEDYPRIFFTADHCMPPDDGSDRFQVSATLSVRGTSKRFEIPATVTLHADTIEAEGSFDLRHADFGIEPYSAFLGAVANDEVLTFHFRVKARLRE